MREEQLLQLSSLQMCGGDVQSHLLPSIPLLQSSINHLKKKNPQLLEYINAAFTLQKLQVSVLTS